MGSVGSVGFAPLGVSLGRVCSEAAAIGQAPRARSGVSSPLVFEAGRSREAGGV